MNIEQFLKELKEYGIKNDVPNISLANANFIRNLIKEKNIQNVLELWTANGYSTIHMWIELQKNGWKITGIEISEPSYNQAIENVNIVWLENTIKIIKWDAMELIPNLKEKYDMIFIDSMKKWYKDCLKLVQNKLTDDGIIILDDVIKFKHKMINLYDYLEESNIKYEVISIDEDDGIMTINY